MSIIKILAFVVTYWRYLFAAMVAGVIAYNAGSVLGKWQGGRAVKTEIRQENQKLRDKADAAEHTVDTCPAGRWNRSTGKCD